MGDQEMTLPDTNPSKPLCTSHSHVKNADGSYAADEDGQWIYKPCQRYPMKGQEVCAAHGGRAPQAVAAAKRRLLMASDPVTAELVAIALDRSLDPADRIRAQVAILDRAGIRPGMEVEVELPAWQEMLKDLVAGKYDEPNPLFANPEPVKAEATAGPPVPALGSAETKADQDARIKEFLRGWDSQQPGASGPAEEPLTGEVYGRSGSRIPDRPNPRSDEQLPVSYR